jgi:hypothetical protein
VFDPDLTKIPDSAGSGIQFIYSTSGKECEKAGVSVYIDAEYTQLQSGVRLLTLALMNIFNKERRYGLGVSVDIVYTQLQPVIRLLILALMDIFNKEHR